MTTEYKISLDPAAPETAAERDRLQTLLNVAGDNLKVALKQRDQAREQVNEAEARLACVTSAFLVLSRDKSITGGARKLIEKEMELMRTGKSGSYILNRVREAEKQVRAFLAVCKSIASLARFNTEWNSCKIEATPSKMPTLGVREWHLLQAAIASVESEEAK